jgi:host factor-I protein
MENKTPSQNIQDVYLNTVRRDKAPVTVFLISGVKLLGKIKGFDKYSVILEANNQEQLIFKHAISTVTTAKMSMAPPPPPPIPQSVATTTTEKYTTTTEK